MSARSALYNGIGVVSNWTRFQIGHRTPLRDNSSGFNPYNCKNIKSNLTLKKEKMRIREKDR